MSRVSSQQRSEADANGSLSQYPDLGRARLEALFDHTTFEEIDSQVVHRATDFGMDKKHVPGDGVVTGLGQIEGRTVFAYAEDRTVFGGSLGEAHAKKIIKIQDLAIKARKPLIQINDSAGARIQEGVDALGGYGEIFRRNVALSGVSPQITLVMGACAGGAVYSPALTDFVIMVDQSGLMFITGPKVIKAVTGETVDTQSLGGTAIHTKKSGVAHFVAAHEADALHMARRLLSYLPDNNTEPPPEYRVLDSEDRRCVNLKNIVPANPRKSYDVREVIEDIADRGSFMEVHAGFAPNIVVGFARLGWRSVGIIANQPKMMAGVLDINASRKAARFIRFLNAFNLPIISLVDVPGFMPGKVQEHGGIINHGAKLVYAYCEASVPKLTVILRKAYGGAYIVMGSKHVGGDINLAWPGAEVAVMGSQGAVDILYHREIAQAESPEEVKEKRIKEYEELFMSPQRAAERGYLDGVIDPADTRAKLCRFLSAMADKQECLPQRRNGNIQL